MRDLVRGVQAWPQQPDPVQRVLRGAVQVTARTEHVDATALRSPAQVLAALHVAAAAPVLPEHQLGRPRRDSEDCPEGAELGPLARGRELTERLDGVAALLQLLPEAPVLLVAALVHAEVATLRPFVQGNGLVARALERAVVRAGGLDPTGVAVPEAGHSARAGGDYRGALAAYASRTPDGVRLWLLHCAEAVVAGAGEGGRVADAVLAGRVAAERAEE
ncbi:Fic family protein [Ornithinicoccus halotolerans]|uniref:Fic family protein n=1 Tax=Ornithinicoccus halotolerans TaxID=1748220 RepID=UPI001885FDAB|nr:Fic family protein [Ornithinicoccus halotolerans]